MDALIQFGGAVKALGGGRIEAPLITFGDAKNHDLVKDFFDAETNYWTEFPGKAVFLYNHGQDDTLKSTKLGGGTVDLELREGDDAGVWLKGQLNTADRYEAAIYKMAEQGKLGTSSGAVSHLVERKSVDGAQHVTSWPIFEASLTPEPCEPRNYGRVLPIKSASDMPAFKSLLAEIVGEGDGGESEVKATYLGANIEGAATVAALSRVNDALMYRLVPALLNGEDYGGCCCGPCLPSGLPPDIPSMSQAERMAYLRSAFDEFRDISLRLIDSIAAGSAAEEPGAAVKSLRRAYADPESDAPRVVQLLAGQEFKAFLQTMGAVVKETARRAEWRAEQTETKEGRPISADNLTAMRQIRDGMQGHVDTLGQIIEKHTPRKKTTAQTLFMDYLYAGNHGGTITL